MVAGVPMTSRRIRSRRQQCVSDDDIICRLQDSSATTGSLKDGPRRTLVREKTTGSALQVREDGQDAAVVVIGRFEAEFGEDAVAVFAHGFLGDAASSPDRPCESRPMISRSRGDSVIRSGSAERRVTSEETTSGSMTVPPAATFRTSETN